MSIYSLVAPGGWFRLGLNVLRGFGVLVGMALSEVVGRIVLIGSGVR